MGMYALVLFVVNLLIGVGFCSYYVNRIPEGTLPAE